MQATINNVDGAINYIINGEKEHPNRNEICELSVGIEGGYKPDPLRQGTAVTPFGAPSQPVNTSAFGQPSQPNNGGLGHLSQQSNGTFGQVNQPSTGAFSQATTSPFGQPSQSIAPFGQPSAMGQKPSPFGAPSFGAPSQPAGAFGQPTQSTAPTFGQPSQPSTGAFGQPSALGQPSSAFGAPAFGAPSQPASGAFGQPSGLGQKPNPWGAPATTTSNALQPSATSPFGQSSQVAATGFPSSKPNPFGQPSQPNAFGQAPQASSFAQNSQPSVFGQASGSSPFNQPSHPVASGFPPSQPSIFGQPSQSNTFGQPAQSTTSQPTLFASGNTPSNPFGSPSVAPNKSSGDVSQPTPVNIGFAASSQPNPTSLFGKPSNMNTPLTPFTNPGAGASGSANASSTYPLVGSTPQVVNGNTTSKRYPPTEFPNPRPLTAYANLTPDGLITMFKGKPVRYRGEAREPWIIENGTWSKKIWCSKGFPAGNTETEADASNYTAEIEAAYSHLRLDGEFQDGVMPMIPPKKEWSSYEF